MIGKTDGDYFFGSGYLLQRVGGYPMTAASGSTSAVIFWLRPEEIVYRLLRIGDDQTLFMGRAYAPVE